MTETVIIAVNDPNILYLLQRYSEECGLHPIKSSSGKAVLNQLTHRPSPALLILDIEFPDAASPQALSQLRAAAAAHDVPIVLYSCLDEPTEEWSEGVAAHLPKSVMYDDFVGALKCAGIGVESVRHS